MSGISDLFSRFGGRKASDPDSSGAASTPGHASDPAHPTKALPKFLKSLQSREGPTLIDLGPVVGSNVTFFGEQLGCRLRVEDLVADIERHLKAGTLDQLPAFFDQRLQQPDASVEGVLCWDVFDYLEKPAAQVLATHLTRMLRPEGVLLGFFSSADSGVQSYTKYIVVDEASLRYRSYPASRPRQRTLLNRDIIKLFEGLRVTDSFLMKNNLREILFKKPL